MNVDVNSSIEYKYKSGRTFAVLACGVDRIQAFKTLR
jgi:hypothetical protein